MKTIKKYFITGLVSLIPIFLLYQIIQITSSITESIVNLPIAANLGLSAFSILLLGWFMVHIFQNRVQAYVKNHAKDKGVIGIIASVLLDFDSLTGNAHKAFNNPILYKVDDGIYKLGYITNEDVSLLETAKSNSNSEAKPTDGAVWVYSPYPVNFFGDMLLVESRKIRKLDKDKQSNLPLFILSAGIIGNN